ncbi:hypothetical protein FPZ43_13450 [Mucilaginibacter pallidiroseus]|uniref:Uncharacterized protein n=1 Tax=Mucilaginibacter pallidiroseus TaxID=2599295 RepID=A0A563U815_9SPHI|nr:hypothetical protein [Mucilaginibacter pallidiroseus]TWR27476.1 hypothetical protein FPZ43_13450 [Mucilaginibacter pallidiroseus]
MKKLYVFLLPALVVLSAGCIKSVDSGNLTGVTPSGSYAGEFRLLLKPKNKTTFDTTKATIRLELTNNIDFKVLGDTTVVHAGSKGTYGAGSGTTANLISFIDTTYPRTGKATKTHLNGTYVFSSTADGLQLLSTSADTLRLEYDLKRVK